VGGVAEPSQADEIITTSGLARGCSLIVGDGTCASLAERGLL
jgi:DNA repair protein RadC